MTSMTYFRISYFVTNKPKALLEITLHEHSVIIFI